MNGGVVEASSSNRRTGMLNVTLGDATASIGAQTSLPPGAHD
jgi:hypothetical protein